jgi:chromosome segregation ATPase
MGKNESDSRKDQSDSRTNQAALLAAAETIRPKHHHPANLERPAKPDAEGGVSVFWRVFGGTILSIAVLIVITVCNQFSSSLNDLRRDLNAQVESRSDLVKKADLDYNTTALWTAVKETRASASAAQTLTDKTKSLEQWAERQAKNAGDDRKELLGRIEENRKSLQDENRDTVKKLDELRKTLDDERKDYQRKLDEQRKTAEDERKELAHKFEDKQKRFEEQNKELTAKLQGLAERLAAVESLQNIKKSVTTPAAIHEKKNPPQLDSSTH